MAVIQLDQIDIGAVATGTVWIKETPSIRESKTQKQFMVGKFFYRSNHYEFKIWESYIFEPIRLGGPGLYDVSLVRDEFNGSTYFTVRNCAQCKDPEVDESRFYSAVPREQLQGLIQKGFREAEALGLSPEIKALAGRLLEAPELNKQFFKEGAAVYFHDNRIGGLANHTFKMLRIGNLLLEFHPLLRQHVDLFVLGILLHDVGKVFEYECLSPSTYWYVNHRVRGIEFLTNYRDEIIEIKDETFYRQLQAIIAGHHGEHADRPTTIATLVIHYIDYIESQVTGLMEQVESEAKNNPSHKLRHRDFGWLYTFEDLEEEKSEEDL